MKSKSLPLSFTLNGYITLNGYNTTLHATLTLLHNPPHLAQHYTSQNSAKFKRAFHFFFMCYFGCVCVFFSLYFLMYLRENTNRCFLVPFKGNHTICYINRYLENNQISSISPGELDSLTNLNDL